MHILEYTRRNSALPPCGIIVSTKYKPEKTKAIFAAQISDRLHKCHHVKQRRKRTENTMKIVNGLLLRNDIRTGEYVENPQGEKISSSDVLVGVVRLC